MSVVNVSLLSKSYVKFQKYLEKIPKEEISTVDVFSMWFKQHSEEDESADSTVTITDEKIRMIKACYKTLLYNLSQYASPLNFTMHKLCIEKYMFQVMYDNVFPLDNYCNSDEKIFNQIERYHLDQCATSGSDFDRILSRKEKNQAIEKLKELNDYKTPSEKLFVLREFNAMLLSNESVRKMNCDDSLSLLVYLIACSGLPLIYSNIQFISELIGKDMSGICNANDEYLLTQFQVALMFILNYKDDSNVTINYTNKIKYSYHC